MPPPAPTALEARFGGMYSETAPARTVETLEALGVDPVVGPGGQFTLFGRGPNHSRRTSELEGGFGARRSEISAH